jgi:hypothetical protein
MLSDQQMVTGAALLCSGYSQLRCNISSFHWQIIIYLVWYSSFTHLATLTVLRRYLRDHKPVRWWRLSIMSVIVAGLCVALVPTGNGLWLPDNSWSIDIQNGTDSVQYSYSYVGMPAACFFNITLPNSRQTSSMVISILLLFISYTTRAIKLFQPSSVKARKWLRTNPGTKLRRLLDKLHVGRQMEQKQTWIISIPYWFILSLFLIARAIFDLAESMIWEVSTNTL